MKVLLAPQNYKGSFSSEEVSNAMKKGVNRVFPSARVLIQPIADGGDGTLAVLHNAFGGKIYHSTLTGANQQTVTAEWGYFQVAGFAYCELAKVCGFVENQIKNPLKSTTYGLGELILEMLGHSFPNIVIGLGGSVTNDGGTGLLSALGYRFLDSFGEPLPLGGGALSLLSSVDSSAIDPRIKEVDFTAVCDVINPLLGPKGCTRVYAKQKGASLEMEEKLENAMEKFCSVTKEILGCDLSGLSFGGAAGGTAAGLKAYLNAELVSGSQWLLEVIGFDELLDGVDLVITGEGRMDGQTLFEKAPLEVAKRAKQRSIPVIGVAGALGEGYEALLDKGFTAIYAAAEVGKIATLDDITNKVTQALSESQNLQF